MATARFNHDLLDMGEVCAPNTVAKLMQSAALGHKSAINAALGSMALSHLLWQLIS